MNRLEIICLSLLAVLLISPVVIAQLPGENTAIAKNSLAARSQMPLPANTTHESLKNLQVVRPPVLTPGRTIPPPYPVIPMLVGNGFAFSGNEFHIVKMDVVGMRKIPVQDIKPMIAEGRNLTQIKEALVRPEGVIPVWKGHMKFGEKHYVLNVTELDKKHIKADILAYPPISTAESNTSASIAAVRPKVVGALSIEIKPYEGSIIGTGKISFNPENPGGAGDYDVYLYVSPDRPYIEPMLKPMTASTADNE